MSEEVITKATETATEATPVKRGRGRPKGSKNKPLAPGEVKKPRKPRTKKVKETAETEPSPKALVKMDAPEPKKASKQVDPLTVPMKIAKKPSTVKIVVDEAPTIGGGDDIIDEEESEE